jgi:hypothetical protein
MGESVYEAGGKKCERLSVTGQQTASEGVISTRGERRGEERRGDEVP